MRKREIKILASLLLSLTLLMSLLQPAAGAASGHWAGETLAAWEERGWLTGDGNGNLRPDDPVTRAEFAAMINRSFGLGRQTGSSSFKDLPESDWAYSDIQTAIEQGYLKGNGDGTVRPHQPITREEAAVMIARLLGLEAGGADVAYKDREAIAAWSLEAVAAVSREGIFKGRPDGTFNPRALMTRAEAAVSLDRALAASDLGTLYPKAGTYGPEDGTETIEGNVTVMAADVTLRNLHITGDLIIAASVGEGDVYLNGVKVDGSLIVRGGGENSVHLTDAVFVTVVVDKKLGTVRLVAEGRTVIREVELRSSSIVHASGLSDGGGISVVKLSEQLPEHSRIELRGGFEQVNVEAKLIRIAIPEGSIGSFEVGQAAQDVDIELSQEAAIVELILNAVAKVIGEGEVGKAVVNAEGVSFEKAPQEIEIGENVPEDAEIVIGGESKNAGEVQSPSEPAEPAPAPAPVGPVNPGPSNPGSPSNPPGGGGQPPENDDNSIILLPGITTVPGDGDTLYLKRISLRLYDTEQQQPIKLKSVDEDDDGWRIFLEDVSYLIAIYEESVEEPVQIIGLEELKADDGEAVFSLNHAFNGNKNFKIVLTPSKESRKKLEIVTRIPDQPIITSVEDNDRTPGVDGKDFTVKWIPSGRSNVELIRLYIVPIDVVMQGVDFEEWTPVEELEAGDEAYTWTGTDVKQDSTGKPIKHGVSYVVYVTEYGENPFSEGLTLVGVNSKQFKPVADLHMDYDDPGPDPAVPASGPNPTVYVTADKTQDRRYATVGDIVYGKSDMDGYLYLLPTNYLANRSISYLETAVRNGEGLRVRAEAYEWVELNTSWLRNGQYVLIGLSNNNQFNFETPDMVIDLFADETEPLALYSVFDMGDRVMFTFNKEIFPHAESLETLKSMLRIKDHATSETFELKPEHELQINLSVLTLTLPDWVSKGEFSVIIPAGALKDRYNNVNSSEIVTWPYEFRPRIEIDSVVADSVVSLIKDESHTIVSNKDIHALYLIDSVVYSSDPATYELEVAADRALKLSLKAGQMVTLSLDGLDSGIYQFVAVDEAGRKRHLCFVMI